MPRNNFERGIFALMTVLVTVHAYVFYSLYIVNGNMLMSVTGKTRVLEAIEANGGVYMLGRCVPIWAVVLTEFCFAYCLEMLVGSPCSFKLACKVFDLRSTHPVLFETAIICATVGIMCPAMSFIAAWLKLVCFNFPFAFFTQLFFIQPLIRTLFKAIFRNNKETAAEST